MKHTVNSDERNMRAVDKVATHFDIFNRLTFYRSIAKRTYVTYTAKVPLDELGFFGALLDSARITAKIYDADAHELSQADVAAVVFQLDWQFKSGGTSSTTITTVKI